MLIVTYKIRVNYMSILFVLHQSTVRLWQEYNNPMGTTINKYTNQPIQQERVNQTQAILEQKITQVAPIKQKPKPSSAELSSKKPQAKEQSLRQQSPKAKAHEQKTPLPTAQINTQQKSLKPTQSFSKLIVTTMPIQQVKSLKECERKRTHIFWLKELAGHQKQNTRDGILRQYGYQVYSTSELRILIDKYNESNGIRIAAIVLYSYSHFYNNQETIKRLHQYFMKEGRAARLFIIKPIDQGDYRMEFNNISSNHSISELPYPIQYIRHKIAEFEVNEHVTSFHFLKLQYWEGRQGLFEILRSNHEPYEVKCKLSIEGCLRVGQRLIDQLDYKDSFKQLLKIYAQFHDLYMNESALMRQINKQEGCLQRIGMRLLEDPINFYLNPTHHILIDRVISFCGDYPEYLNAIALPLNLLARKIKEDYDNENSVRRYRDQFISYLAINLSGQYLSTINADMIFENIGFMKTGLKNTESSQATNTLLVIHVNPVERDADSDRGYCFIGTKPKHIDQDIQQEEDVKRIFEGYSHVLFNILNSFRVISHRFDNRLNKHIIELQYGFISAQMNKKTMVNLISEEAVKKRYISRQHQQKIDYESIIIYESNRDVIKGIDDYGDCFCLLERHSEAIAYYDRLFARCKTQMNEDLSLLSSLQYKKGMNLQLSKNSQHALEYFYNAYNLIRKAHKYSQIELSIMRCLQRQREHQKMASFGRSLIQIANRYKFINSVSKEFLLQLYGLMARAYQMKGIIDLQLKVNTKEIISFYQKGQQIVDEIGEYSQFVPFFYLRLAKYYIILGQHLQALTYLNKSLLIMMTIHTQKHPKLCPFYQLLAVAYVSMHDYSQALRCLTSVEVIYNKYYEKDNYRLLALHQIKGKVYALLDNFKQSLICFKQEEQLLCKLSDRRHRNLCLTNVSIGFYNLVESKELTCYFDPSTRKSKQQISLIYVLQYQAHLYKLQYDYASSMELLARAHNLSIQQERHALNLEILLQKSQIFTSQLQFKKAKNILQQAYSHFLKGRRSNDRDIVKYHQQLANTYQCQQDYSETLASLIKIKEVQFRVYSNNSLQNCVAGLKISRINLMMVNARQSRMKLEECEVVLQRLRLKAKNGQSQLFGRDLQKYLKEVELSQCECLFQRGWVQEVLANYDEAIQIFRNAMHRYQQHVGEYHPSVADICYHIGKCYLLKGQQHLFNSIHQFGKSLAIYQSTQKYNLMPRVQIYIDLSVAYERKNELSIAIEQLVHAINILTKIDCMGKKYVHTLAEVNRIMKAILTQPNLPCLKSTYFATSRLTNESKSESKMNKIGHKGEFKDKISKEVATIEEYQRQMREYIEKTDNQQQQQEKRLMKKLGEKQHYITLQKIKENLQIRKQLRNRLK